MVDLLGFIIFLTIVGIGLLDLESGLSPFAVYRSAATTRDRRRAPRTGRRGDDNQPRPPEPAR